MKWNFSLQALLIYTSRDSKITKECAWWFHSEEEEKKHAESLGTNEKEGEGSSNQSDEDFH